MKINLFIVQIVYYVQVVNRIDEKLMIKKCKQFSHLHMMQQNVYVQRSTQIFLNLKIEIFI